MLRDPSFWRISGLMLATTIGAGIFGLPAVFDQAGALIGTTYLVLLVYFLQLTHELYLRILERHHGQKERLVGYIQKYLGREAREVATVVIGGGLLLVLVAYLVLGGQFLSLVFSQLGFWNIIIFWAISTSALLLRRDSFINLELLITGLMIACILGVGSAIFWGERSLSAVVNLNFAFLPFGVLVFALSGWPAVEPIFEYVKNKGVSPRDSRAYMRWGTIFSALLYLIFVFGILRGAMSVTEDTISGLSNWPEWGRIGLFIFGLMAMWTSYGPIGETLKNSFNLDLGWSKSLSLGVVIFLPLLLVFVGFSNFLNIIGLVGGVFLGIENIFIVLVAHRAGVLKESEKISAAFLVAIFILAAIYELYYFIVN